MDRGGIEPPTHGFSVREQTALFPRKSGIPEVTGSKSPQANEPFDADLQAVIDRWPELPEPIKAGIVAMIRAAGGS